MKNIFLLGVLLVGISSSSQSIQETTDDIIDLYNLYERPVNSDNDLIIEDGILFYKMTLGDHYGFWHQFHLKDIKEIEIKKEYYDSEDKIGWTNIYLFFDPYISKIKDFDGTKPPSEYIISYSPGCYLLLNSQFMGDGMAPRMEEALIRLIKLSGGSAEILKESY